MKLILFLILIIGAISRSYPLLNQCDSRWGNQILGVDSGTTICQSGCLMTSVTMALVGSGYDFNPSTFNQWLINHGGFYDGGNYIWSAPNQLGMRFQGKVSNSQIKPNLDEGRVVLCLVRGGTHWVLAHGYSGDTIYVNDPAFDRNSYDMSQITDGQNGIYIAPEGKRLSKGPSSRIQKLVQK